MYDFEPGGSPTSGASPQWDALAAREPALLDLEKDLLSALRRSLHADRWNSTDRIWHDAGFKRRLSNLVGWGARCPALQSTDAYHAAYGYLWDLMERYESIRATGKVGC